MTATEILAEIARLSALLPAAITSEDWDGDVAAALGHLADAQRDQGAALNTIADRAEDMDGAGWETVTYEAGRASDLLASTSCNLRNGADAATAEQDATAEQIKAAGATHLSRLLNDIDRPSSFLTSLFNMPGSASAA